MKTKTSFNYVLKKHCASIRHRLHINRVSYFQRHWNLTLTPPPYSNIRNNFNCLNSLEEISVKTNSPNYISAAIPGCITAIALEDSRFECVRCKTLWGIGREHNTKLIVSPFVYRQGLEDASLEYFRYHSRRRITSLMNSEIFLVFGRQHFPVDGYLRKQGDPQTSGNQTTKRN